MQQPDKARWQVEDVDRVDDVAHVAEQDVAQAIRFQILRPECSPQDRQRAESKDRARDYPSDDWQIRFHDYSLLNFQIGSLAIPSIR